MSQAAKGTTAHVVPEAEPAVVSSPHSSLAQSLTAEQLPIFDASSNGASPAEPQGAPAASNGIANIEADPELLKQQLQLIQLCFAEHEFGIVVDEKGEYGNSSSSSSSSGFSRSSSESFLPSRSELKNSTSAPDSSSLRPAQKGNNCRRRHRNHHHYSSYDPLTFVKGKLQHGVPLAVLSQDLHSYAQYLEDKIAACVNTDVHTAFVNVSGHLFGMRDELSYMERPLALAMEKLSGAVAQLSTASQGVKAKVEAACTAEMERTFDAVYLRGIITYETIAYQLDDLAQLLHITVDTTPSRSSAASAGSTASTVAGTSGIRYDAGNKNRSSSNIGGAKKDVYTMAPDTCLSDGSLDVLEDIVVLFQELKEVSRRLVALPSRQQEKVDMAGYVAAAEQAVMGVLEVVLVHVSRLTFGFRTGEDSSSSAGTAADSTTSKDVAVSAKNLHSTLGESLDAEGAPFPAARQLLGRIIQLYSQAGEREQFCVVFRNAVLRPPLEAIVSWKAATQARQSAEGTVALLEQIKMIVRTKYLPLLPLLRENYGAPLHPVATIVWPVLSETLVKKLPSLYEVGIPNHFQVKYKAAYSVLALVEAACVDLDELTALRQSSDVVLWNAKWNLDVYAALRVSEMDKALQSVASPLDPLPSSSEGNYHLRLFYILRQQLLHLFSPSVFLYLCTPRFLRQTVACCYRVLQRVGEAIATAPAHSLGTNVADVTSSAKGDGGVVLYGTADAADSSSADDMLLLAISDTYFLRSFLTNQLLPLIFELLNGESEVPGIDTSTTHAVTDTSSISFSVPHPPCESERSTAALVTDVIEFAGKTVCDQFVKRARTTLVRHVTDAAMGPLQAVKTIRSVYSHTRKTLPAAASWYVATVLEPLRHFAFKAQRCGFADPARDESVLEMLCAIVQQFVLLARDTLITAKRTEESWEKLRRRKEGAGAAEANAEGASTPGLQQLQQRATLETATDRDKMTIQLWIDARALWEAAQQPPLSVAEPAATAAFAPAFELLRRAEWIQGANIPEPPDVEA